jgi:monoamine oxidase
VIASEAGSGRTTCPMAHRSTGEERGWPPCSIAHLPPGILTRYGALLREPFGRVHWAGTETSTTSHGAIDGAVRSGERVAAEIIEPAEAIGSRLV